MDTLPMVEGWVVGTPLMLSEFSEGLGGLRFKRPYALEVRQECLALGEHAASPFCRDEAARKGYHKS